jgi:hypothetical protein
MILRRLPVGLGLLAAMGVAAATTNGLSEAEIQGRQLARQLVEQWPATNFTQAGVLRIRDGKGKRAEVPVQFKISVTASNWQTVYSTQITGTNNGADFGRTHFGLLTITHFADRPNVYTVANVNPPPAETNAFRNLAGEQTMTPFAGTDFWIADLGLEFLHWPEQKLLKREFKRGCGCRVLDSTHPHPSPNGYSRVVSWIDNETGGIVQAEGYDIRGKLLKEFAPKSFKKVNGQWELQEMEIRNVQTGSRTRLEFDLRPD